MQSNPQIERDASPAWLRTLARAPHLELLDGTKIDEVPYMNIATLRIEAEEPTLSALRAALPSPADKHWRKGERGRNGSVHALSGFNATIAEAPNPGALVSGIRNFLTQCKERNLDFRGARAAELSIGFTVGDSQQFVASLDLSSGDLSALAACGMALSVTAYPTSDGANE